LRQQLDLGQNQDARHRLRGNLKDAGLTEHAGTRPSGGPIPVDCWTITDRGRQWVVDNIQEIAPPQALDEACEQIRMLSDSVGNLQERMDSVEGSVNWDKQRLRRIESNIAQIQDSLEQLEEDSQQHQEWIHRIANSINDVQDRVDEAEEDRDPIKDHII